jgi:tetratricopeptide (TPR) repeat protein
MARIYVSSTFKDLKEYREKVRIILKQMSHEDIAMEYYVAEDKRPVDRCLEDVASCDLYIGIFAWRYGFVPKGYDKSITELEYRKAAETGKKCLIFLLHGDAPWPISLVDMEKNVEKIVALRKELSDEKMVSFFKSSDNLASLVGAAVHKWENERRVELPKTNQEMPSRYNPSELPKYPEKLKKFVTENRVDELRKALTYLENHRILLISGVGGVGKSTLARAFIDFRPLHVPEPFWFSFYKNQDAKLGDILEKLATYMNAPEIASFKAEKREPGNTDVDRLTGELNRRSEVWLFFDDLSMMLEDQQFADKGIEFLFSSLRFNTHNAKVIVTSRILPILENGESLIDVDDDEEKQHLNGLRTNFAVNYLASNGLDKIGHQKLEELSTGVDGHPLALKLLVELVKEYGPADILSDLDIYQEQKEDTIKKARKLFDKLAGDEKDLLERISVYREPVKLKGLKEMFTENSPKNAVKKLRDKSLLETDHNGNYWLHPLVQEFSYEDLKDKKEAHLVAYNYYKSLSLPEKPIRKEDLQPAIEAHYHACEAGEYDLAAYIIEEFNIHNLLDLWGNPRTLIEIYEKLLPKNHFKGEPILKDKHVHGVILGNLGLAYSNLGEPKKAVEYYVQALKIGREIGDRRGEANHLGNLGNEYYQLGEPKKAIEYYEQTLIIHREIGYRRGEGADLGNLGSAYCYLGEPRKAIEYHEQALKIQREIGDRRGEGNRLVNLGIAHSDLGEYKKAIEYYEQTLIIYREIGDRHGEGNCLGNLGNAYRDLREPGKAIEYYEQILIIQREIGDRRGEGNCLGNLGVAFYSLGETRKAIEYYEQALKIQREIGDRRGEGANLGNLGLAYSNLDDPKKAIEYYEQALKIDREIGYRRGEGADLGNLGLAYRYLGEPKKAIEFLKESLAIGKAIEDPRIINFCKQKLKELEEFNK